jgi:DNA-binding MarR family transcriptional regulator
MTDAETDADLDRIDRALVGLRHLWSGPLHLQDPDLGQVEMSTVWIVNALADTGQHPDRHGMSTQELATALDVAHSTASRLVDRAVSRGVVTRGPVAHDARLAVVALTDRGHTLAATAGRFRTAYLAHVTHTWTDLERATFADLLTRFATAITSTPPTHLKEPR